MGSPAQQGWPGLRPRGHPRWCDGGQGSTLGSGLSPGLSPWGPGPLRGLCWRGAGQRRPRPPPAPPVTLSLTPSLPFPSSPCPPCPRPPASRSPALSPEGSDWSVRGGLGAQKVLGDIPAMTRGRQVARCGQPSGPSGRVPPSRPGVGDAWGPWPLPASWAHRAPRPRCARPDTHPGTVQELTVQHTAQRGDADGHHAGLGGRAGQRVVAHRLPDEPGEALAERAGQDPGACGIGLPVPRAPGPAGHHPATAPPPPPAGARSGVVSTLHGPGPGTKACALRHGHSRTDGAHALTLTQ